jgi:hypothetical protein
VANKYRISVRPVVTTHEEYKLHYEFSIFFFKNKIKYFQRNPYEKEEERWYLTKQLKGGESEQMK